MLLALLPGPTQDIISNDSARHVIAFVILTILLSTTWQSVPLWQWAAGMIILGGAIEVAQGVMGLGREPSWSDWLIDVFAVMLAIGPSAIFRKYVRWAGARDRACR